MQMARRPRQTTLRRRPRGPEMARAMRLPEKTPVPMTVLTIMNWAGD